MGEVTKAVGQWIVGNVGWTVIIILFILSALFKLTKREIDPLGWVVGWFGKMLTKDVRKDVADMKTETNGKISDLRADLDSFEERTKNSMADMQKSHTQSCALLKKRLVGMEKSNDMQTVRQIKAHVLDFANSCMNKRKHTKMEFENIIKENEEYETLCKKYRLKNNVYTEDYAYIMKIYHHCQDEGTFLKDVDTD